MTTENPIMNEGKNPLLPPNIHKAPFDFWQAHKLEALVFLIVNLLFGTMGLWLPTMNAFFGPSSMAAAIVRQLNDGGFYMYAITFLSAIGGVTFTSIASEKVEHSRNFKVVLAGSVGVALFICAILLQAQLFMTTASQPPSNFVKITSYVLQVVVALVTTIVAIYVFSIVNNEQTGSAKDDIDRGAIDLLERAQAAGVAEKGAWTS